MCLVLWRGFARAGASSAMGSGPVPQGVSSLLRTQLTLEIEVLSCPKPRLVCHRPLVSLLPLQSLLGSGRAGVEQPLMQCLVLHRWPLRYDQWWECKFIAEGIIDQGRGCGGKGLLWGRTGGWWGDSVAAGLLVNFQRYCCWRREGRQLPLSCLPLVMSWVRSTEC